MDLIESLKEKMEEKEELAVDFTDDESDNHEAETLDKENKETCLDIGLENPPTEDQSEKMGS